ncbi:MAG TPA: Ig-like domain-containing protein [Anaerolineae bacterium]|nr:Ig-like domain-containing protein [Anaerolineae bacterium]
MSTHTSPYTVVLRVRPLLIVSLLLALVASLSTAGVGRASNHIQIAVNSTADAVNTDGACTLREAIIAANKDQASSNNPGECAAGSGVDTIVLPAGTYTLIRSDNGKEDSSNTGDLDIAASVVISPTGPVTITASSGFSDRIFHILGGSATISGVTISGGNVSSDGSGIYNLGTLTLLNSTVSGNKAGGRGGGIYNAGAATLANVTISGNTAKTDGGGLYNTGSASAATLNNVTVTANTADSDGNGSGNGGGVFRSGGTVGVKNTIIAGNTDNSGATQHPNCSGSLISQGHNLIGPSTGCAGFVDGANGDRVGVADPDLNLGSLQDNGGATFTHALLAGSPAIDAGNPATPGSGGDACSLTDQRGAYRPRGRACDIGAFEAGAQNSPVVIRVVLGNAGTTVDGRLFSAANTTFTLTFYTSPTCDGPKTLLGSSTVTTNDSGNVYFRSVIDALATEGQFVTATATDPNGNVSGSSSCVTVGQGNDAWTRAFSMTLTGTGSTVSASASHYIDLQGQSRWYKFSVQPGSKVIVALTDLPANYDLTVYKDISATLRSLLEINAQQDLSHLGAEFAIDAFSPEIFSPEIFSPEIFSPEIFSPEIFSPEIFSPEIFSPEIFSPEIFSPEIFSPEIFSPDALSPEIFSPEIFSPEIFSPEIFSPEIFSPEIFSPEIFSGAQTRSVIAVSGFDGTAGEGVSVNTWNNTGDFYVRVRGRNGAFSLASPFRLQVVQQLGACSNVSSAGFPPSNLANSAAAVSAADGPYKTAILIDSGRMGITGALMDALDAFAARPEVRGVVLDVSLDDRVTDANDQADERPQCPFAKNLVAESIKGIVDAYRDANPTLEYAVIVGNDNVIPFFRYPDNASLANENNYVPPVRDNTASQASLRLGFVLSQDAYGSRFGLSLKNNSFPIPDLAVGRLVETEADVIQMLDAYMSTTDGVAPTPASSLVTGYDFLADAANAVNAELVAGMGAGASHDTLIDPRNRSPQDADAWTADDLRDQLLDSRHDLIFLAGHFSAGGALAADYRTRVTADEIVSSSLDWRNVLVFSAGCHAGYNIVNPHGIPGVTADPDWAQAFNGKGASLVAGTGYQYGDTDFVEYSERLYVEFAKQLRAGSDPVAIGQALVQAKQAYLANTPVMRGIHEKSLLEATLFGLPMLKVDLPSGRGDAPTDGSIVPGTSGFAADPGQTLGLRFADVNIPMSLTPNTVPLSNTANLAQTVTAQYLSGSSGTVSNPGEPVLPLESRDVSVPGLALRGVGFRGGSFTDLPDILPFLSAATTELRAAHAPFLSDVFYPIRPWNVNYFDALSGGAGVTRLDVIPAQVQSGAPGASTVTLRQFDDMSFRLYYSSHTASYSNGNVPALAAAPSIVRVLGIPGDGNVTFHVNVVGSPGAGMQEAWITFTALSGPYAGRWQSLDLAQSLTDSTLWTATLPLAGTPAGDIRYIVQAVNGVGLVGLDTNKGAYYIPGNVTEPTEPAVLEFQSAPSSGTYGARATFSAKLTSDGMPLGGQRVVFRLGPQSRLAFTDNTGVATATLSLLGLPGQYEVRASFAGTSIYLASSATAPFEILHQDTILTLDPTSATVPRGAGTPITATLTDAGGRRLPEKTVFFVVTGSGGSHTVAVITDYLGRAPLGGVPLPVGVYAVNAYFSGVIPLPDGTLALVNDRYISSTATGSLTIFNRAPVAGNDAYSANEDATLFVAAPGVLSNDSDPDGDSLSAILVFGPLSGTLALNADGSFTYTPNANFNGGDSFTYKANDGFDDSSVATVSITVHPVNDNPVAGNDAYSVNEDTSLNVPAPGVLGNDSDIDGDGLTAVLVNGPAHGALTLNANGSFVYTPDANFHGGDSFTYKANDGAADSNVATVVITVHSVNGVPVCTDAVASTVTLWPPDKVFHPVTVLGVTDPDGDMVTITITGIRQDEPTGTTADGMGLGTSTAYVRAERDGNGDGRVYHIFFTASDGRGSCDGQVRVGIMPHDQSGTIGDVDQGPLYDSTVAQ